MKVEVSIKVKSQEILNIMGDLNPCLQDGKKACNFRIDKTVKTLEIEPNIENTIKDIVCKAVTNEGYGYYHKDDKNNVFRKYPFRDKKLEAILTKDGDNVRLTINNKTFDI